MLFNCTAGFVSSHLSQWHSVEISYLEAEEDQEESGKAAGDVTSLEGF